MAEVFDCEAELLAEHLFVVVKEDTIACEVISKQLLILWISYAIIKDLNLYLIFVRLRDLVLCWLQGRILVISDLPARCKRVIGYTSSFHGSWQCHQLYSRG